MKKSFLKGCLFPMIVIIAAIVAVVAILIIVTFLNPLSKSEERIRANLLEIMPIGTDMQEVVRVAEGNNRWTISWVNENYGYLMLGAIPYPGSDNDDERTVGVKSMRVILGHYTDVIVGTHVLAFFAFDEDDRLVDIAIWKSRNVL
jgi:hypothetical protein